MRGIRDGRSLGVGYADAVKEMRTLENPSKCQYDELVAEGVG